MDKFKKFRESLWFTPLVGVIAFVAGGFFNATLNAVQSSVDHTRDNRTAAIQSFEAVAFQLEPLGAEYVDAKLSRDDKKIKKNKDELLINIANQVAAAKKLEPYFDNDKLVYDYMDSVIRLKNEINTNMQIEDMKPYWNANRDVLIARDAIVKEHN